MHSARHVPLHPLRRHLIAYCRPELLSLTPSLWRIFSPLFVPPALIFHHSHHYCGASSPSSSSQRLFSSMFLDRPDWRIAPPGRRRSRQNRRCCSPIVLGVSVKRMGGRPRRGPILFDRQAPHTIASQHLLLLLHCIFFYKKGASKSVCLKAPFFMAVTGGGLLRSPFGLACV
jgi:hypothetical protein